MEWDQVESIPSSVYTFAPSSWSLISCAVWTWYLVCLAPTFIGLASLFILMDPFAFFSDMTMLRTVWFIHMKV